MQRQTTATAEKPSGIRIRPLHDPAEFRACQEVQRRAWGITEDGFLVPVATLAGASAYGGLVLGAFAGEALVGFSFAFRGVLDGTPILYSQLTGVLPEAQGGGTGRRIKQFQREWARDQGLPLVAWAFDPLQAMNAHYNIMVLRGTATHYHPNFYGVRQDALNPGLPTDRLLCILPTDDPLPVKPDPPEDDICFLVISRRDDGGRVAHDAAPAMSPGAPYLGIETPRNLKAVSNPALARWQGAVRSAFGAAFAAGYRADGFHRGDERAWYVLTKGEETSCG
jgi:predicted GNAT superfamily acetyltransferase